MKTAAAYIRVSTDMQTELSPDSQLHMIRQYAEQHDIRLPESNIFSDEGLSGRKADKRPGFQQMIAAAKQKPRPFDMILVWKFSRFARSREDSIVYKSMLRSQCGIEVISVSEPMSEDKTSILIESMLEAMDEYYSINLAEEVRRGMEEKFRRGGVVTAPPIGYAVCDGNYIIDENEAAIVRKIFADILDGKSVRRIAAELNSLGLRTKRGNRFDDRSIEYILTNPVYIGRMRYCPDHKCTLAHRYVPSPRTIEVEGDYEHIIDVEVFDAVQKLMEEKKSRYAKYHRECAEGGNDYYFRGIVRCSDCGAVLTRSAKGQGLQCCNFARGKCGVSHYISVRKLKNAVLSALAYDMGCSAEIKYVSKPKVSGAKSAENILREQLAREQKKLERIKAAYEEGIDTLDEYKASKAKLLQSIDMIKAKLTEPEISGNKPSDPSEYKHKKADVMKLLGSPDISPTIFNEALLTVIEKIVFDRSSNIIRIFCRA